MFTNEEAAKMSMKKSFQSQAIDAVEQQGIVFIDEIDKIARRSEGIGADVSIEVLERPSSTQRGFNS